MLSRFIRRRSMISPSAGVELQSDPEVSREARVQIPGGANLRIPSAQHVLKLPIEREPFRQRDRAAKIEQGVTAGANRGFADRGERPVHSEQGAELEGG